MTQLALASIAYNEPRLIAEQIRLLDEYLEDEFELTVFDQSSDSVFATSVALCARPGRYERLRMGGLHHEGLNEAARILLAGEAPFIGFLDHDVFPTKPTRLVPLIEEAGFYGVGQRHPATGRLYLWPGFCFFSRAWLAGREPDFSGIRGKNAREDGDTGSSLWPLFADEDWAKLYRAPHGYRAIREPDDYGLQSWGVETIGDWLHLSNGSHWMDIPDPGERDRLVFEMLAAL